MPNEKPGLKSRSTLLAVLAVVLVLGLHFFLHLEDIFRYRHLRICDPACAAEYLLILFVPSLLSGALVLWAIIRRKKKLTPIAVVLLIAVLILSFLPLLGSYLFTPTFCSSTDDVENYSKADIGTDTVFPDAVPENAQHVQYFYWYMNIAAEHWFRTASWELSDADFEAEIDRLRASGLDISPADSMLAPVDHYAGKKLVLIDWERHRIAYFSARLMGEESLPSSLEEFYSTEYSIETILDRCKT